MNKIEIGKNTIQKEINGLMMLRDGLSSSFELAVNMLDAGTRIIVAGVGKSGHIARKIASTLASVGHPAYFLQPGDASHGDLGMIDRTDTVMVLSNSGETLELHDLLYYCKRLGVNVIGVTGNDKSTLAQMSSVVLAYPHAEEACPLGLAPTTSTTMCLALGDALAVALYNDKLTVDQFRNLHPGGQLGNRLMLVRDLMRTGDRLPLVTANTNTGDAIILMTQKAAGCVGVINDKGNLEGIVTDGDLRRHIGNINLDGPVSLIMSRNPRTVKSTAFALDALNIMNNKAITNLFVVDDKNVIGIIHIHDCLKAKVDA